MISIELKHEGSFIYIITLYPFYKSYHHLGISKSSLEGNLGNRACGSRWYQNTTEEISDFCG